MKTCLLLFFWAVLFSPCYAVQLTAHNSWNVPNCASFTEYRNNKGAYVKMPLIGSSLFVPRPGEVRFRKVKDVDYVLYIFSYGPRNQASVLQGWFGPYAASTSVRDKSIRKSATFAERWAMLGDDKAQDSYGQTRDGKHWRYLNLWSSALYYEDASKEAASVFDSMLAKMCYETWKP